MPRRKEQRPATGHRHIRVEIVRADIPVIDPRDGRAEQPLIICVLDEDGPIGTRVVFEKDFRLPRRAR
jgi:hypothetical protein